MKKLILRKASSKDLNKIVRLANQNKYELGYISPAWLRSALERDQLIVALINSSIVGFQEYRHLKKKSQTTLYHKVVEKNNRRKKIGTKLVYFVFKEALLLNKKNIIVKCVKDLPANLFHLAIGFKKISTERNKSRFVNVYEYQLKNFPKIQFK